MAQIIVEAEYATSDSVVCKRWNINPSTLSRWRKRAESNQNLQELIQSLRSKLKPAPEHWQNKIEAVLLKALNKLDGLLEHCNDPKDIGNVLNSIQTVGELIITQQVLSGSSPSQQNQTIAEDAIRPS